MKLLLFAFAFVAEIIGTVAGFGASTILLPLATLIIDFPSALTLSAIVHITGNISRILFLKAQINYRIVGYFGIASVICTIIGAHLVHIAPMCALKIFLGCFLGMYGVAALLIESNVITTSKFNVSVPHPCLMILGGTISGFLTGLIGTGGSILAAFVSLFGLTKEAYIVTIAAIALMVDITRIPIYITQDYLQASLYWYIPGLLVTSITGAFIGTKIVKKLSIHAFKKYIYLTLIIIGIKFIVDGVYKL